RTNCKTVAACLVAAVSPTVVLLCYGRRDCNTHVTCHVPLSPALTHSGQSLVHAMRAGPAACTQSPDHPRSWHTPCFVRGRRRCSSTRTARYATGRYTHVPASIRASARIDGPDPGRARSRAHGGRLEILRQRQRERALHRLELRGGNDARRRR